MARRPFSSTSPALQAHVSDSLSTGALAANLLRSLRPAQWTKNLILFAGLIFGQRLFHLDAVIDAVAAFAIFCALSGVVYLVNDVRDRDADRTHPLKSQRPIAQGVVAVNVALATATVLGVVALAGAFALSVPFGLVALGYVVLLGFYSFTVKHVVILDVLTIALGFVLRAIAGAVAVGVPFSSWLLLCTLLLALFLGLSKRRAELVALGDGASTHRRSLAEYSPHLLDQMIGVVTASTLLAYAFYTISSDTVQKFGTEHLIFTVPFPLYGIFRYLYLVHQRQGGGNPADALLNDRPLLICIAFWAAAAIAIVYGPGR
jgi:4-hydroxybenzoate polyprenyltransferase